MNEKQKFIEPIVNLLLLSLDRDAYCLCCIFDILLCDMCLSFYILHNRKPKKYSKIYLLIEIKSTFFINLTDLLIPQDTCVQFVLKVLHREALGRLSVHLNMYLVIIIIHCAVCI